MTKTPRPSHKQKRKKLPTIIPMKSTKRVKTNHGGQDSSILSYFSTSSKKNDKSQTPLLFGTPATPVDGPHHFVDAVKEIGTPASVVSNDLTISEPSAQSNHARVNLPLAYVMQERRTRENSSCDNDEPYTPPPPATGCHTSSNGTESEIKLGKITETPPSNEANTIILQSPPTPDNEIWMKSASVTDQTPNDPSRRTRIRLCNKENIQQENEVHTVKDSLSIYNGRVKNNSQQQQSSLNLGTPATSDTPSTTSSNSRQPHTFFKKYAPPTMSKRKQSNQLFLDLGQKSFGKQTVCHTCGMLRVHGLDEDDAQHAKICEDYKQGVVCMGWKNERMITTLGRDDRVLEVRSDDAQLHVAKVLEVKEIVDKELGFASTHHNKESSSSSRYLDNMTCYMYISKKRVVGLLLVKRIQRGYEFLPCEKNTSNVSSSISRSLKPSKALMGIHQIWVHKSHRHRGIASNLVTAARDHLIFGMVVPLELIAFSSPTEEGLRFAQSYVGSERPLIYDIR
jgi:N-acetyltransferase